MPCFRPIAGWRSKSVNPTSGKRSIVWSLSEGDANMPVNLPCGQCRYCRMEHSRQWAMRSYHESKLYSQNCFLTLTYDPKFLPENGCLDYEAPVLFMKRLREKFGSGIRSFGCAEYGEKGERPHYHLCLFNFDFSDKKFFKYSMEYNNHGSNSLYVSDELTEIWGKGHCTVGDLTFESAAYVARYVTKKVTGERAEAHYEGINEATGEVYQRPPERSICVSRRPGLGKPWYDQFGSFVRTHDYVVVRGKRMRPPKYYDRLFEKADPVAFAAVKKRREAAGELATERMDKEELFNRDLLYSSGGYTYLSLTPESRLSVMERFEELKFNFLKRGFEDGEA